MSKLHLKQTICQPSAPQAISGIHSQQNCQSLKPFSFILQYIGSLEVGRPGSRMEIVAAMRRIRVRRLPLTWPLFSLNTLTMTQQLMVVHAHSLPLLCFMSHLVLVGSSITSPRKSVHSDSVGCQEQFKSRQDSGGRFYGWGDVQRASLYVIPLQKTNQTRQGHWKRCNVLSLHMTAVLQRSTGSRGFSCLSAVGSNLTTELLCHSEVRHISNDTQEGHNPDPSCAAQHNGHLIVLAKT